MKPKWTKLKVTCQICGKKHYPINELLFYWVCSNCIPIDYEEESLRKIEEKRKKGLIE